VLENVPLDADVWTEEIFAPVLSLAPYDQFEEALSVVNTSKYGLQTGVFTQSLSLAWLAFQKLQTGAVLINQSPSWRVENMPYGGVKQSGEGREGIAAAIETMTSPRSWIWKQPL
jgi:acyl-CoA reductase-like NAD-dependent aldehyde dehydrogenase